jgi:hypothetical protein
MNKTRPILVTGVPRSGTTWISHVLSLSSDAWLVHEPDNERNTLLASYAKRNLSRMPFLEAKDTHTRFYWFWNFILNQTLLPENGLLSGSLLWLSDVFQILFGKHLLFNYHHMIPEDKINPLRLMTYFKKYPKYLKGVRRIVKSVHAGLSLSFIDANFHPRILIILRHPANIISSYIQMNLPDANRNIFLQKHLMNRYLKSFQPKIRELKHPLELMGLQVAIFYYIWEQQLKNHPHWNTITHESLCQNPVEEYKRIFRLMDLPWNPSINRFLKESNTAGNGYQIQRVALEQINKWKTFFEKDEIKKIQRGYSILPVEHFCEFRK